MFLVSILVMMFLRRGTIGDRTHTWMPFWIAQDLVQAYLRAPALLVPTPVFLYGEHVCQVRLSRCMVDAINLLLTSRCGLKRRRDALGRVIVRTRYHVILHSTWHVGSTAGNTSLLLGKVLYQGKVDYLTLRKGTKEHYGTSRAQYF